MLSALPFEQAGYHSLLRCMNSSYLFAKHSRTDDLRSELGWFYSPWFFLPVTTSRNRPVSFLGSSKLGLFAFSQRAVLENPQIARTLVDRYSERAQVLLVVALHVVPVLVRATDGREFFPTALPGGLF